MALAECCVALLLAALLALWWLRPRRQPVDLRGAPVVITGGAGGLGRALALSFARAGASVELWDVRAAALEQAAAWLAEQPGVDPSAIHTRAVDVSDAAAVGAAAAASAAYRGAPRVVVNNAALVYGAPLLDLPAAALRRSVDVNVLGYFWVSTAFARLLLPRDKPFTLVTIGSAMAAVPAARLADYCAAKAAVAQLHACLRCELAAAGEAHRASCLHVQPYLIADTPLFDGGEPMRYRLLRWCLPPLRAAEVADCVVHAVQTRRQTLALPWVVGWVAPLLALLPCGLQDWALGIAGAQTAMRGFRGRGETDWKLMS
ncbi:hypothetical protein AB1Y20_004085 [Prymnesium parvum]|uniref:Uncharacterized protein n=1 Tax=Prymnesium parvum TaxID=97485 RepID=A0AB34J6G7_PRYPA